MSDDLPVDAPSAKGSAMLAGLNVDRLLARGLQRRAGLWEWDPPGVVELTPLLPGYEVASLAGRGGMGAVYHVRQLGLDRWVALKLLPLEISADTAFAERFRREARTLAHLEHPGIVRVFDSGETSEGHLFYTMEFVEGEDLQRRLRRSRLEVEEAFDLLRQLFDALDYAHSQGVVHRDIKPSNIILTREGRAKLVDFGLATRLESELASRLTRTGTKLGTLEYSAPEQVAGAILIDHRADIYSLGVVTYELLTGKVPRGVFDPPSKAGTADWRFDDIVMRALQEDPAKRFETVALFRSALMQAREEMLLSAADAALLSGSEARVLEEFYAKAVAGAPLPARLFVEEELVTRSGFRDSRALEDALSRPGVTREALGQLVERKLLRMVERGGSERIEIAHERLAGVVQASRDQRRAEEARAVASSREEETRRQLRRRNRLALGFGVLAVLAVAAAGFGWFQQQEAERFAKEAEKHREASDRQRNEAQRQSLSAQHSRAEAEKLVKFMLGDLQYRLFQVGRLDIMHSTAQKVEAYYDTAGASPDDASFLSNKADFLRFQGNVRIARNELDAAQASYGKARDIRRQLIASHPGVKQHRYDLTEDFVHLGNVASRRGDFAEAEELFGTMEKLAAQLLAEDESDLTAKRILAYASRQVGAMLRIQRRWEEAAEKAAVAVRLGETLANLNPQWWREQSQLSISLIELGDVRVGRGDVAGALEPFGRAHAITVAQLERVPDDAIRQAHVCSAMLRLADTLLTLGRGRETLQHLRPTTALFESLADKSPENLGAQEDLLSHYSQLVLACRQTVDLPGAEEAGRKQQQIRAAIAARKTPVPASPP